MRKSMLFLTATLCVVSCMGQNTSTQSINENEVSKQTDALVQEYMDLGIFSGVVVIANAGRPFYQKAFGLADRQRKIPNTLNTKFVIGSMNKSFTRVLILQLIQEGKLKRSDRLVKYLDGFSQKDATHITIEHLLNHTSGFGDYHGPEYFELKYNRRNIQGILPILRKMNLLFEPGTEMEYSNAGYIILGAVIEKITGKSYGENVEERIAQPLGLSSLVTHSVKQIPDRAIGYLKTLDGYEDNEEFISEPRSDGGFYANIFDILKFYREYFYGDRLIGEEDKRDDGFFSRIKGFYNEKGAGIPVAGGFNGANTVHLEMLADHISIVVFANMDEPVAENLAFGIHRIVNGKTPKKPTLPVKLNVYNAYQERGGDYVKENFDLLTENWFEGDPKDLILNGLGYDLLWSGRLKEALDIFKLNTELFPEIGNCWDSYGEALLKQGDREGALIAYKKALELNPDIPSAQNAVKELEK